MASLSLTTSEVLGALALVMGVSRNAADWDSDTESDARQMIRDGLRKFFNCGHQWNFLERPYVKAAPSNDGYNTGTVTVANGTVTLAGGVWPTWAEDGILRVDGQSVYVTDRVSDTVLTISHDGLAAAALSTYSLHRWRFPLPDDFGEFIGGVVYSRGENRGKPIRKGENENEIRLRYAANFREGDTGMYCITPGRDTDVADNYFAFWPTMDAESVIAATYRAVPADQLHATDLTTDGAVVQVGPVHSGTLLKAILAAAEEYYNDEPGVHSAAFADALQKSIAHDKRMAGPVMPDGMDEEQARAMALFYHVPTYHGLLP
jgi:hypothetical protein